MPKILKLKDIEPQDHSDWDIYWETVTLLYECSSPTDMWADECYDTYWDNKLIEISDPIPWFVEIRDWLPFFTPQFDKLYELEKEQREKTKEKENSEPSPSSEILESYEHTEYTEEPPQDEEKFNFDYSKFSYSWDLQQQPFKEILAFQDWKIFLNYESFSYFLIFSIIWIMTFKLLVKILFSSFTLWFNIFKWWKK